MNKYFLYLITTLLFINFSNAQIIKESYVSTTKIIITSKNIDIPFGMNGKIIIANVGKFQIDKIKSIDIFIDNYGKINGIRIIYIDGLQGDKSIFIRNVKSIIFEKLKSPMQKNKKVHLRVLTIDELIHPW